MGNKRYFWFKLYDDFFSSKRIKKLRRLAGGDTLTIIYLKMQLKALKNDGYLYFDDYNGDYSETFFEQLALDLDEEPINVNMCIQYLLSVGLLEMSDNGKTMYLTYLQNCIGSETASAQRVRDYRNRKKEKEALQCNTNVTKLLRDGSAEKEIEKDIDIDIEKDKKRKNANAFILPTVEEVRQYCIERHNNVDAERFVDFYSSKNWMIGKNKMKDWKAAVRTWEHRDNERAKQQCNSFNNIEQTYTSNDIADIEAKLLDN